jgi:hypothetical protein
MGPPEPHAAAAFISVEHAAQPPGLAATQACAACHSVPQARVASARQNDSHV